ncbi:MAG: hypothetical protein AAGI03_11520 [Pseudomonadota bacterium]
MLHPRHLARVGRVLRSGVRRLPNALWLLVAGTLSVTVHFDDVSAGVTEALGISAGHVLTSGAPMIRLTHPQIQMAAE